MKILIDFDDVLSDTFAELERREGPASDFSVEDLFVMFPGVDLRPYFKDQDFHRELPPIPGAAEWVHWIVSGGHDVRYVSARRPEVEDVSLEWLKRWDFPLVPLHCLGRDGKKELLRGDPYEMLIDDQMRYLRIAREHGKRAIAMDQRWNGAWDGDRIANWAEIESVL